MFICFVTKFFSFESFEAGFCLLFNLSVFFQSFSIRNIQEYLLTFTWEKLTIFLTPLNLLISSVYTKMVSWIFDEICSALSTLRVVFTPLQHRRLPIKKKIFTFFKYFEYLFENYTYAIFHQNHRFGMFSSQSRWTSWSSSLLQRRKEQKRNGNAAGKVISIFSPRSVLSNRKCALTRRNQQSPTLTLGEEHVRIESRDVVKPLVFKFTFPKQRVGDSLVAG